MTDTQWEYLSLQREGRVLEVTFRSPNKVNSLNSALMRELTQLAQELQFDSELSAIILTGAADIFSAGMDLKDPEAVLASSMTVAQRRQLVKVGPAMCAAWEALEPVTIVAIEGWCIGGGTALAVSCDWRVAATAERRGLFDYLCAPGEALGRARELAAQVAAMPPIPVRMAKRAINASVTALDNAVSYMDADQFLLAQGTEDALEGALSFFEKRPPQFSGN